MYVKLSTVFMDVVQMAKPEVLLDGTKFLLAQKSFVLLTTGQ